LVFSLTLCGRNGEYWNFKASLYLPWFQAQFNVELRFTNSPPNCLILPCPLRFCAGQNCTSEKRIEFEGMNETPIFIPFEEQSVSLLCCFNLSMPTRFQLNVAFSLQVIADTQKQKTQKGRYICDPKNGHKLPKINL
jgi:hypothetical protein